MEPEILTIVQEIQEHAGATPDEKRTIFGDKYPQFADKYPGLFYKSCEEKMDMNMLRFMIGKLGEADGDDKVGEELFTRFVSPAFVNRFKKDKN